TLAIGTERHGVDVGRVSLEGALQLTGHRIPHDHGSVMAARGEALTDRAESDAPDLVTAQNANLLARRQVPQPYGPVPVRRGEAAAIRAERHAGDRSRLTGQVEKLSSRCRVPDLHLARPTF